MQTTTEQNKAIVLRFNKECIEQGKLGSFHELVATNAINHAAAANAQKGPASFIYFINNILRNAFPDLRVDVLDQVAEGAKVTTRKVIHATHTGELMGIAPTHKTVMIQVIDIIRIENGQYAEHWGASNFQEVFNELRGSK